MAKEKISKTREVMQEALINDKDFLKTMVEKFCQTFMEEELGLDQKRHRRIYEFYGV